MVQSCWFWALPIDFVVFIQNDCQKKITSHYPTPNFQQTLIQFVSRAWILWLRLCRLFFFRSIESTVYSCKICNYTAMSQSDLCRNAMHPVKKIKVGIFLQHLTKMLGSTKSQPERKMTKMVWPMLLASWLFTKLTIFPSDLIKGLKWSLTVANIIKLFCHNLQQ